MSKSKVLFINTEVMPYLPESRMAKIGRQLPQGIQEAGHEIRTFMPRFGVINERRNQLHEVIRLSGMNIIIGDVDRPLVIKVASISAARMQVYFIDNEDYFKRKQVYGPENGKFFEDNGERAAFFARGVLETVKKLRWAPDIIHCIGWMSCLLPLYLKKAYIQDPIFSSCKAVTTFFNDIPAGALPENLGKTILYGGIKSEDVFDGEPLDGIKLAELAARYSDGVAFGSEDVDPQLKAYCEKIGKRVLPLDPKDLADGTCAGKYNDFYEQLHQ